MSDIYTYYDSDNVEIYPSSNAKDSGKLVSEDNLHNTLVYAKIKDHTFADEDYNVSYDSGNILVTPGIACINGYVVSTLALVSLEVPSGTDPYDIVVKLTFDSSKHIKGDNGSVNEGVSVELWTPGVEPSPNEYIFRIGTLTYDGDGNPIVEQEPGLKYAYMAKDIGVLDAEDDNNIKSVQDLFDLLPGRYVSKLHDDTKYGNLEFIADGSNDKIIIDNTKVSAKSQTNTRTFKANKDEYSYNDTTVLSTTYTNTDIATQITGSLTEKSSGTAIYGNTNSYLKFTGSDINGYINNSLQLLFGQSSGSIYSINLANKSIGATGGLNFSSDVISNYDITAKTFKSSVNGFEFDGTAKAKIDNSGIRVNESILRTDNANLTANHGDTYVRTTEKSTSFNRPSSIADATPQIKFLSAGTIKASIGNKYDTDTIDITGNLTVSKDVNAARVFSAVYNDYAELYRKSDLTEEIEPGDIIELKPDGNYGKCDNRNSNVVVGVCSDTYGHLLGGDAKLTKEQNLQKYIPIGLSGRVKVKCITENVLAGDLLVSSEYAGYAMVNNFPVTGTVIGKALSGNENGYVEMQIMLM